jgi:hypothetical protein
MAGSVFSMPTIMPFYDEQEEGKAFKCKSFFKVNFMYLLIFVSAESFHQNCGSEECPQERIFSYNMAFNREIWFASMKFRIRTHFHEHIHSLTRARPLFIPKFSLHLRKYSPSDVFLCYLPTKIEKLIRFLPILFASTSHTMFLVLGLLRMKICGGGS